MELPAAARALGASIEGAGYLADDPTLLAVWLALELQRPLLIEGPPGVGKTDLARAAATALARPLIRLQCYEGLDEAKALYEWDYAKQMLYTQLLRDAVASELVGARSIAEAADRVARSDAAFFSERFLVARPLLAALRSPTPAVLLIDEIDRADPELEALLLELLAEWQVTVPELGALRSEHPPLVLLTSNATRDMTDALRRRCLHVVLDYPSPARERAILAKHLPGVDEALGEALTAFAARVRGLELRKAPSISETIDWARALVLLGARTLGADVVRDTLGVLVKHEEDRARVEERLADLLAPPRERATTR